MPMHEGSLVLSQLMDFLPKRDFDECVKRSRANYHIKEFPCRDAFPALVFSQLTYRESLRDIETCLNALQPKLYHAGFRGKVSKSTLADANKRRDWRIYADFAHVLIRRARALYARDDFGVALKQAAYALDSTTIDLCLALFPWARFRPRQGAAKLNPLIPRAKRNIDGSRPESRVVDKSTGLRSDQTIVLQGPKTAHLYPTPLRRIAFYDDEHQRRLVFLTITYDLPP